MHATAEDFTGKPVNKKILERAVDMSAWAVRGRMAAEAAGRAIARIHVGDILTTKGLHGVEILLLRVFFFRKTDNATPQRMGDS